MAEAGVKVRCTGRSSLKGFRFLIRLNYFQNRCNVCSACFQQYLYSPVLFRNSRVSRSPRVCSGLLCWFKHLTHSKSMEKRAIQSVKENFSAEKILKR